MIKFRIFFIMALAFNLNFLYSAYVPTLLDICAIKIAEFIAEKAEEELSKSKEKVLELKQLPSFKFMSVDKLLLLVRHYFILQNFSLFFSLFKSFLNIYELPSHNDYVSAVVLTNDNKHAVTVSHDLNIIVTDLETVKSKLFKGHAQWINTVAISNDNRFMATGSWDRKIKIWDFDTCQCINTIDAHDGAVTCLAFSPDDKYLISCSWDGSAKYWNLENFLCEGIITGFKKFEAVACINSKDIALGDFDGDLFLGNLQNTYLPVRLMGHSKIISSLSVHQNRRYLLTGSFDSTIKFWDIIARKYLRTYSAHLNWVTCVKFLPNSPYAISGSRDKTLKLINLSNKKSYVFTKYRKKFVTTLDISKDGKFMLWGCNNGSSYICDLTSCVDFLSFEVLFFIFMINRWKKKQSPILISKGSCWYKIYKQIPLEIKNLLNIHYKLCFVNSSIENS